MKKDNKKAALEQVKFCKELMDRLCVSVEKNLETEDRWVFSNSGICYCNQMSNDIVRLRRELNGLNKIMKGDE